MPADVSGRWSTLPGVTEDPTLRATARAELLLERYGVLTRGAVVAEDVPGGFAGVYRVCAAMEDTGRLRRGYFVEGLGAAQFATAGAVDRLRAGTEGGTGEALVLAAADPANPYGASLAWPERGDAGHRPGRKAGAVVVLVDGALVLYVERGGRSLLSFAEDEDSLARASSALVTAVQRGRLPRLTVTSTDGDGVLGAPSALARALGDAGFRATPRGLRAG